MNWDISKSKTIIKILPTILYHTKNKLLDIGWLYWSFIIQFK